MPTSYTIGNTTLILSNDFRITLDAYSGKVPDDLRGAVEAIQGRVVRSKLYHVNETTIGRLLQLDNYDDRLALHELELQLSTNIDGSIFSEAVKPVDEREEGYTLTIPCNGSKAILVGKNPLALYRGLTTFEQLLTFDRGWKHQALPFVRQNNNLDLISSSSISDNNEQRHVYLPTAPYEIHDEPAFSWRGLMLDTSRNFFPKERILATLDAMSMVKLNVFHWHITDSHSWPLLLEDTSELALKGAYSASEVYDAKDIQQVIKYAGERGIDVLIEVDVPGHTASIHHSHPDLVACFDVKPWHQYANEPPAGQLRFMLPAAKELIAKVFRQLSAITRSAYIGIGGDELNRACYEEDPISRAALHSKNRTFREALNQFTSHLQVSMRPKVPVVWHEAVIEHNMTEILNADTIVIVWSESSHVINNVLASGFRVVAAPSDYFYLDCGTGSWIVGNNAETSWCDPYKSWNRIYEYDPYRNIAQDRRHLILGGETALWTEQTDEHNLDQKLWPRAAALAELYWTGESHHAFPLGKWISLFGFTPRLGSNDHF